MNRPERQADQSADRPADSLVEIVLPVFNELGALDRLLAEFDAISSDVDFRRRLLFVDDGSTDGSRQALERLAEKRSDVRVIRLSRNFGHSAAVQAGLTYATGDAVVLMDSDLQDDPAAIAKFVAEWRRGADVVYAVRTARKESWFKRSLFATFYRLLNAVSDVTMPLDAGNFGLIDRRVARAIAELPDRDRYFPGLRRWVGYRQSAVEVERRPRYDGVPRVSYRGLFRLAKSAIFSFSSAPLTFFYSVAGLGFFVFLFLAGFTLYFRIFTDQAVPGWTSNVLTASFFGSINSLGIAVLGEYVVRIYQQVRGRPLFLVAQTSNFDDGPDRR